MLNFRASSQKLKYFFCLISKAKQLAHEKVDHLPTQNLKDKQTSGTDNHHLNKKK